MNVLESASIYSEMKASLLRTLTGEVDTKEDELDKFLSTLYLDTTKMLAGDPPFPQSLYNLFARMDSVDRDPNGELSKQLKSLVNLSVDGDSEFENLSIKMKDVEEFFDMLVTTKGSEKTKNFNVIVKNFKERFKTLSDANEQAKQSNNQLKELITNQLQSFDILKISLEEFIKKLPSVNNLITDSTLNNIAKESQRLFDKVNEMRQQRVELINQLRTNLHLDDVDSDLLIIPDEVKQDLNSWFENRLKSKHDHLVNIIKQNLKAQENIQSALIDLNAEFAPKWTELSEIRTKRSEQIDNILLAGEAFDGILSKSKQGIDFYNTLINQLKDLDKEIDQFIEDLNKQLSLSMDELSKPVSNLTIGTTPQLPTASTPSFPTLGDYMKAMRPTTVPTHPNMYMGPMGWPVPTLTSRQPNQQLNLPTNPATVSSPFATTSISPNHSVVNSFVPSVSPDVYYKQKNVSQHFPYHPTAQPPFRGPMTYTPMYNSQQFPTTGVNIQPAAVPMPGSSYAAGFQTTNPMQTAVHRSPTVAYGAPQVVNMVNPLVPPCQRPNTFLPQTTNMPPSQPNNISGTFESRFLPNIPRIPVLTSTTTSSLSQFPIPVNSRFSQPNNFIQTSIRSTNPLVSPNYSSTNSNQFPPQSVWPYQSINNNLTYQNPPQNYSKTLPTENFNMVGIRYRQSNSPFPNTLSYQNPMPHINNSSVNPGQISIASQHSYTTLPNHSQSIYPVSQCNTNATTQSLLPTNVTQTYINSQYPDSNSNNSTEKTSNQIKPFNSESSLTVLDTDNDAYLSSRLKSISPIEPQVLTKDDLDAKLREKRLRETYSGNSNSPSLSTCTSNLIKSSSSSSSSNFTTVNENKNSSLNPIQSDPLTSSIVTPNSINCQPVLSKFPPPELLSDPLVLNQFITSAELLLTWLENPNELISTGDSDIPVTSSNFTTTTTTTTNTNTTTITRLNKAWQKVQTLANSFTTSIYFNGKRPTHAIALCCPSKNRNQNYVPYDNNRVILKSLKNDYINASYIDFQYHLGDWCPRYIIAQAPMIKTIIDFWTMILEQNCEIVVTLIPSRMNCTTTTTTTTTTAKEDHLQNSSSLDITSASLNTCNFVVVVDDDGGGGGEGEGGGRAVDNVNEQGDDDDDYRNYQSFEDLKSILKEEDALNATINRIDKVNETADLDNHNNNKPNTNDYDNRKNNNEMNRILNHLEMLSMNSEKQSKQFEYILDQLNETKLKLERLEQTQYDIIEQINNVNYQGSLIPPPPSTQPSNIVTMTESNTNLEHWEIKSIELSNQIISQLRTVQGDFSRRYSKISENMNKILSNVQDPNHSIKSNMLHNLESRINTLPTITSDCVRRVLHEELLRVFSNNLSRVVEPLQQSLFSVLKDHLSTLPTMLTDNVQRTLREKNFTTQIVRSASGILSTELSNAYRDSLNKIFVPALEKSIKKLFTDLNNLFQLGTQQYLNQISSRIQPPSFDTTNFTPLMNQISSVIKSTLNETLKEVEKKSGNSSSLKINPSSDSCTTNTIDRNDHYSEIVYDNVKHKQSNLTTSDKTAVNKKSQNRHLSKTGNVNTPHVSNSGSNSNNNNNPNVKNKIQTTNENPHPSNLYPQQSLSILTTTTTSSSSSLSMKQDKLTRLFGQAQVFIRSNRLVDALELALVSTDQPLLLDICNDIDVNKLFSSGDHTIGQNILLSLIHQLSCGDLTVQLDLKLKYLQEAILCLEFDDPTTSVHGPAILHLLNTRLDTLLNSTNNNNNKITNSLRNRVIKLNRTVKCLFKEISLSDDK